MDFDPLATPPREGDQGNPRLRLAHVLWLCILAVAAVELVGHYVVQARVPEASDWDDAAAFVRETRGERDLIVAAPNWADPLARRALGDALTLAEAGPSDLAPFERVTELSIRGRRFPSLYGLEPVSQRRFGRVTVRRYELGPSPVVYDLTSNVASARVTWAPDGQRAQACRPTNARAAGARGGLGAGPMTPRRRFQCDPRRPWLWVGETVTEDLALRPRHCVWQHPGGGDEVIAVDYAGVPLGGELVLYAGLYTEHERMREHTPFVVRVLVDGREVGVMTHRDGDGWKRMVARTLPTGAAPETRGDVRIEVTADNPHLRTACWAATLRAPTTPERLHHDTAPIGGATDGHDFPPRSEATP